MAPRTSGWALSSGQRKPDEMKSGLSMCRRRGSRTLEQRTLRLAIIFVCCGFVGLSELSFTYLFVDPERVNSER